MAIGQILLETFANESSRNLSFCFKRSSHCNKVWQHFQNQLTLFQRINERPLGFSIKTPQFNRDANLSLFSDRYYIDHTALNIVRYIKFVKLHYFVGKEFFPKSNVRYPLGKKFKGGEDLIISTNFLDPQSRRDLPHLLLRPPLLLRLVMTAVLVLLGMKMN